jgi:AcrR family transcriptional regulator
LAGLELEPGPDRSDHADIAGQIARRSVAEREAEYADEVRRLLTAGLAVIVRNGTKSSPRVADIVAKAGASNDVFYRHFKSKDELVTAILDDGTIRLQRHVLRRMDTATDAAGKIRAWVTAVMGQAASVDVADVIRAVLWNGARVSDDSRRRISARDVLARPLVDPIALLGSADADRDAAVVCNAVLGRLEAFLWRREAPSGADVEHLVAFCLNAVEQDS